MPVALQSQVFKAVSAGLDYSLALTINGKVRAWGTSGMTTLPFDLDDYTITAISAGDSFALALDSNGVVHAWGNDLWGQTEVPQQIQGKTTRISTGTAFTVAASIRTTRIQVWGEGATTVRATARKAGYLPEQTGWLTTAPIAEAIVFLAPPSVGGAAVAGQTLTARPPRTSVGTRITYQWLRAGAPIPGATGIGYRLGAADVGRRISVRAVAQRDGWHPAGARSPPTPAVAKARPKVRAKARSRRGRTLVTVRVGVPGLAMSAAKVVVRAGKKVVARGTLARGKAILAVRKRTSGRLVVTVSPTAVTSAATAKARPR